MTSKVNLRTMFTVCTYIIKHHKLTLGITTMLKTTIADITLDCCIYNASGPRTGSIEALQKVAESKSGSLLFD